MAVMDYQAARVKMVDGQLRTSDVTKHEVIAAFLEIPRELFVPASMQALAYLDDDIEVAPGRYLMEAAPLGKLVQLAAIKATDKVLIVGSGVGYSAAIISRIASKVVALDSDELNATAKTNLTTLSVTNISFVAGSFAKGVAEHAPFDVIIVEGAVGAVPDALLDQLADGGRLVAVEGEGPAGNARLHTRSGTHVSAIRSFNLCVKALPGLAKEAVFAL